MKTKPFGEYLKKRLSESEIDQIEAEAQLELKLTSDIKNDLRKKELVRGLREDIDEIDRQFGMLWSYLDEGDPEFVMKQRLFKYIIEKIKSARSHIENFRLD